MNAAADNPSLLVALGAGVLTFASPCVLPLVPAYISFVAGVSLKELTGENPSRAARRAAILNSLCFILGFSVVFIALGATASLAGKVFYDYSPWIRRIGGVLIALFGIHFTGIFRFGFLQIEKRVHVGTKKFGYAGSFLIGLAFGAGWTPCVGPILGSILVLASSEGSVGRGVLLLSAYSAGIGIPLFAATLGINAFMGFFQKFKKWLRAVEIIAGLCLIVLGVLLVSDKFTALTGYLAGLSFNK